jgi:hypothetical protein
MHNFAGVKCKVSSDWKWGILNINITWDKIKLTYFAGIKIYLPLIILPIFVIFGSLVYEILYLETVK